MRTDTMIVTGMKCGGCTNKLSVALNATAGVSDVQISLASGEVSVRYDEHVTSAQHLSAVVVTTGFGADGVAATNGHDARPCCCG